MSIFCTRCGTANEPGAAFCDNCGAPLRAPGSKQTGAATAAGGVTASTSVPSLPGVSPGLSKKVIYAAVGAVAVLVVGAGAGYLLLKAPAATASTLLAAAKTGYGKEATDRLARELCLSNIDYSERAFNAGENDRRTQAWLNALVAAGLYSPPVTISSGGYFAQTLLQYVPTPELGKYRQGNRLCVAKDVSITDVTDIEKPEEQSLGKNGGPPKIMAVKAKLVVQSVNTAPWMDKPEVRTAFMTNLNGWEYKDTVLQKRIDETFGLKENRWTTGDAYKLELRKIYSDTQSGGDDSASKSSASKKNKASSSGFGLLKLFSLGNPLKGTWRTAEQNTGFGKLPAGTGPDLTFTSDAMESAGQSTEVEFSVDGDRVKVTPKGQSQSLIFVMESPDTMYAQALSMRYERVK